MNEFSVKECSRFKDQLTRSLCQAEVQILTDSLERRIRILAELVANRLVRDLSLKLEQNEALLKQLRNGGIPCHRVLGGTTSPLKMPKRK